MTEFAPKDAETLKAEVLEDLELEYEGNEEKIDKIVNRRLKDEEFKASLHADKTKHLNGKREKEELLKKLGLDPETGEKLQANAGETEKPKSDSMSLKDIRALQDVDDEDVDEVIDFAKYKGISIADAKKSPVIQTLLKTKAEERKTAQATVVSTQRRSTKPTVDLVEKIQKYELSSPEEMKEAAKAFVQSLKGQK